MAAAMKFCFLVSFKYTWFLFVFVFQYYGTSQSSKILVLLHLFKGNQVFKFKTEHKINVYFLIFIALPIVHCTRQKSLLGRHRPSKWLQMAKNAILWPWAGLVDPNWWNKVGTSQSTPRQCHGTISLVKNAHWGAQLPQKCPKKSSKGP